MQNRAYFSLKNCLLIIILWAVLAFIDSAGNGWMFLPEEYRDDWGMYYLLDLPVMIVCFTFKPFVEKDYKRVQLLSSLALMNLSIVYFFVFHQNIDAVFVPFFHPITLSVPFIFAAEMKFKLAIVAYIICYALSFAPFIFSVIPVLFLQLWFASAECSVASKRFERFLARFIMYGIISAMSFMFVYTLSSQGLIYDRLSISKTHEMLTHALAVVAMYYPLHRYLSRYYRKYGNPVLKILSYFPVLWIIPLLEIITDGKERCPKAGGIKA